MARISFTRAEAQAKVGTRVRTRVAFAGVPRGATGTVIRADRVIDGYDVEVAWVWAGRRTPLIDWVTKEEYEARLIELPGPKAVGPLAAGPDEASTPREQGRFCTDLRPSSP
jgi:hypothetical protein